jgi:hypothetical protein
MDRLLDFAQGAFNFQFGLQYWLVSMIEQGLTMMIRLGYEKLRAMLLAFLTVVGPLSLTLSVFPGMEKVASHGSAAGSWCTCVGHRCGCWTHHCGL